jgi:hypothetical protein
VQRIVADEGNARIEERQRRLRDVSVECVEVIQRRGEVVSMERVKQAGNGFVVPERVTFGVVLLQKAGAAVGSVNGHDARRSSRTRGSDWRYGRVCKHGKTGDDVSIYTSKTRR